MNKLNTILLAINILMFLTILSYAFIKDFKSIIYVYKSILSVDSEFKTLNLIDLVEVSVKYHFVKNDYDNNKWNIIYKLLEERGEKKKCI